MNHNFKDITGQRYGKFLVLESTNEKYSNGSIKWKCLCECGNIYYASSSDLKRRKSCGCETRLIDLTGQKFGRLEVLYRSKNKGKSTYWHCKCSCGKELDVAACHLRARKIVSCGCASKERVEMLNKTHGKSKTRLYEIWCGMKRRCYDKNCSSYRNYGERGIIICDEWLQDFQAFYDWSIENGYRDDLSIDRKEVNGNYEPSNCKWSTSKEQSNNTRRCVFLNYKGKNMTMKQIAEAENISYEAFRRRIKKGISVEDAIKQTVAKKRRKE